MTRRKKLTPEQLYASAQERELLGLTEDGRLVLWDTGRVIPVNQFQYRRDKAGRRWIDDGHFIIDWFGDEVCAHLGNLTNGKVSVMLMCNTARTFSLTRRYLRPLLRYKLIRNPERERELLDMIEAATRAWVAAYDAPEKQRGDHKNRRLFLGPVERAEVRS